MGKSKTKNERERERERKKKERQKKNFGFIGYEVTYAIIYDNDTQLPTYQLQILIINNQFQMDEVNIQIGYAKEHRT